MYFSAPSQAITARSGFRKHSKTHAAAGELALAHNTYICIAGTSKNIGLLLRHTYTTSIRIIYYMYNTYNIYTRSEVSTKI